MRTTTVRAVDVLTAWTPGSVRLVLTVYQGSELGYRPVPKRNLRVAVDTPEQAEAVWRAVAQAVTDEVAKWPPVGDSIHRGYGIDPGLDDEAEDV